jgi:hypothetical protein
MNDQLHKARTAANDKRYHLLGVILTLGCRLEDVRHTAESFEEAMQTLDRIETDMLEAMSHAYELRCSDQFEGACAPVVEESPMMPDELIYILNCAKISLS